MNSLSRLLLLAVLLAPGLAAAQLELKPAVGATFSDVSKDPQSGTAKGKVGWQVGGTALLGEKLYLEGGVFYARKSTEVTAASQSVDLKGVTGLRVPVAVGYHLVGDPKAPLALRAFGGGSVFLVTSVDATGLTKSDFESPTYGVFAEAGLDFLFLFADLKYEWSLTDVTKLSTVDVGASRSLFFNVGMKIPL